MWAGSKCHITASLPTGERPRPLVKEDEWSPGLLWKGVENCATTRIRSLNPPTQSELLY